MRKAFLIAVFCLGLIITSYPIVAKMYYNYNMSNVSKSMDRSFQVDSDIQKSQYLQQEAYNETLLRSQSVKAPRVKVKRDDADKRLKDSEDIIATVKIPALKLHYPVYDKATPENLDRGVSRVIGTSYPTGGTSTHSVLAAHSYSPFHEWFTHIDKLHNGDEIIVNNFEQSLRYKVFDRTIVWPNQVEVLNIRKGQDILTLLTCTPSGEKRLLIYAKRVHDKGEQRTIETHAQTDTAKKHWWEQLKVLSDSWFVVILMMILCVIFIRTIRKSN